MNRRLIPLVAGLGFLAASSAEGQHAVVRVTNPAGVVRQSETVEVPLGEILPLIGDSAGTEIAVNVRGSRGAIVSQVTESELLFQSGFAPGETIEFAVERRPRRAAVSPLVDGRYVLPREDYAWENDRIAFRMYGPALAAEVNNGIDVWTKRVRSLVVAKWYREAEGSPPGGDPYHHDRGEGADFFDVGRSLGAGGCALWSGGAVHQSGVFSGWKTVACGPLRVEFELTYAPVTLGGAAITERKRITLDAGENLNRIRVTYESSLPGTTVEFAAGLVKRRGTLLSRDSTHRWMGLWGATNSDTANGSLGTGVVFPAQAFTGFASDSIQYFMTGRTQAGVPVTYYAGAGWTRSGDFASAGDWNAALAEVAARVASPLRVSVLAGAR